MNFIKVVIEDCPDGRVVQDIATDSGVSLITSVYESQPRLVASDFESVGVFCWVFHFPQLLTTDLSRFSLYMTEKLTKSKIINY